MDGCKSMMVGDGGDDFCGCDFDLAGGEIIRGFLTSASDCVW